EFFIHHALLAVAARRCEVALIGYASRQRSRRNRPRAVSVNSGTLASQFEAPYGIHFPIGHYALSAARYMHECGARSEHFARVAVAARKGAALNPKAWIREPLSIEEVLASPLICDPLHKLDCCLVTDGGGVVIVTGRDRARDARKRPVRILGAGESHTQWHWAQCPDPTAPPGVRRGGEG